MSSAERLCARRFTFHNHLTNRLYPYISSHSAREVEELDLNSFILPLPPPASLILVGRSCVPARLKLPSAGEVTALPAASLHVGPSIAGHAGGACYTSTP